ncbi:hypothetical protein [Marinobacter zhejiangensis]|uniref:hypothetical protein n=1 Tax=Marinobacter zhejiangensis TaxID=488535 RepID=UPI001114463D|nr:hypothetical protein [Marinobacter zhejiangensis]
MDTIVKNKYKMDLMRFTYVLVPAGIIWPTVFCNFSKPGWEIPLAYTFGFVLIPCLLAVVLPINRKWLYIPVSLILGFLATFFLISSFFMHIFTP